MRGSLTTVMLVTSLISACDNRVVWDDLPTAGITPKAPTAVKAAWTAIVDQESHVWIDALVKLGCPAPFAIRFDGHPVELVSIAKWRALGYPGNGRTTDDGITIVVGWDGEPPTDGAALHELGHAIGLNHADPKFGRSAMLRDSPSYFAPRDAAAAACLMKCGPCDPNADPYDQD